MPETANKQFSKQQTFFLKEVTVLFKLFATGMKQHALASVQEMCKQENRKNSNCKQKFMQEKIFARKARY